MYLANGITLENKSAEVSEKRGWMRYICHQKPERCFKLNNKPLPLCARCIGFYPGIIPGILICFLLPALAGMDALSFFIIAVAFIAPLVIDGLTQVWTLRESNNILRLATGILAGFGVGLLLGKILVDIIRF